jgi:hypothetical protein
MSALEPTAWPLRCAFIAWLAKNSHDEETPAAVMHWPNLAATSVLAVNALISDGIELEIHSYWWYCAGTRRLI